MDIKKITDLGAKVDKLVEKSEDADTIKAAGELKAELNNIALEVDTETTALTKSKEEALKNYKAAILNAQLPPLGNADEKGATQKPKTMSECFAEAIEKQSKK